MLLLTNAQFFIGLFQSPVHSLFEVTVRKKWEWWPLSPCLLPKPLMSFSQEHIRLVPIEKPTGSPNHVYGRSSACKQTTLPIQPHSCCSCDYSYSSWQEKYVRNSCCSSFCCFPLVGGRQRGLPTMKWLSWSQLFLHDSAATLSSLAGC